MYIEFFIVFACFALGYLLWDLIFDALAKYFRISANTIQAIVIILFGLLCVATIFIVNILY